jgi:membrane protein YdbS with pleckstrin-like domain
LRSFPPRFFLRRDEKILLEESITPAWGLEQGLAWLIVGLVVFGALSVPIVLAEDLSSRSVLLLAVASAFLVFWLLMLLYTWRRIVTSEYVVSEEAVYTRRGRLMISVEAATLDRVTDLHVHTGITGRIFGYSRLVVKTAGGELLMPGLRDAYAIRGVVHDARQRLLTRLLREAGRSEAPQAAPQKGSIEIECPECQRAFTAAGTPPFDVRCPHCKATGTLFAEALA